MLDVGQNDVVDKVADVTAQYLTSSNKELEQQIAKFEQEMFEHARNLEFEEAAKIRADVAALNDLLLTR